MFVDYSRRSRRTDEPHPYKQQKRNLPTSDVDSDVEVEMALFGSNATTSTANKTYLTVPSAPARKVSQRISGSRHDFDDFLSSDIELELERSFASTMSLNSPPRDPLSLTPEDKHQDYAPMDISPAPPRVLAPRNQGNFLDAKPVAAHPKSADMSSASRLFGRDMSNGNESISKANSGTNNGSKRLQRSALPMEWMASAGPQRNENLSAEPHDLSSSPPASDVMDVDSPFVPAFAGSDVPRSVAPTTSAFNLGRNSFFDTVPAPAATAEDFGDFFYGRISPSRLAQHAKDYDYLASVADVSDSPLQPFPKKRRSTSPESQLPHTHEHVFDEADGLSSSPAPASSPSVSRLERIASFAHQKPMLGGLGGPFSFNANKKRTRRPALSAVVVPSEASTDFLQSAYPSTNEENDSGVSGRFHAPPARRAFSAMLPPSISDRSFSEEGSSFEHDGPDMSSPAQAYTKRQHVKTIRRRDGTDDFRPLTGLQSSRNSEQHEDWGLQKAERDTPRSKYLQAGPGFGGFGDNEALGKLLPCHRVKEDGLMRITCETLDALLDGVYDDQIASYVIVDCRFDYEYNGGHIPGAINMNTTAGVEELLLGMNAHKPTPSISGDDTRKTVLVFHCEFSVKRAPTFAKHLRSKDRAMNNHVYPKIHFPEVYVLEGGYCQYFQEFGGRCQPPAYVTMDDPHYAASRKEDLDQFRKGKFGRTKSYAYGEGKIPSLAPHQPRRNTAPSGGTNALFAAANAARTRRGGSGSGKCGLQTLHEDGSPAHHSEDEDTDLGDSPCPPPSKGMPFKGKKIGRLVKAASYGPARMGY
ncbi:M-phase inducer phosphatase [Grifola frondosa]|uniref:M-phase inducer phosphatase n=1 Tax=Grifola frondosa TaxID=5627 RepID=A0A1C7MEY2_GRIFR|nr:M-phase inducer phosphatase [Grifola frondosa]